ncbi:unnamed protein product [Staurois parvus]|uniref:Metalloendopeptidase n=1 Tax=Staurois parvus TaxID=386267 RepID=A0ABN9EEH0_9NEOB|nr:unnamed protein product [Staurois parvus]
MCSCWSSVGKTRGRQTVRLEQTKCMRYGLIQHEIMHALGFFHEHNRFDRDSYVKINWQYISPEDEDQFQKDEGSTFSISYDYTSVMHYSSKTFVNTSKQVSIIPIPNTNVPIGQRTGLSSLDVKRINLLYNCSKFLLTCDHNVSYTLVALTPEEAAENRQVLPKYYRGHQSLKHTDN